ncbi:MAG: BatD family protein [Armatimonadetes bacterium]|nr:BatD family protein [Armatimonadota bacterium]
MNRFSLSTDDLLYMSVTVNSDPSQDVEEPELEESPDFVVIGVPSRESGFSLVNMKGTKYIRRTYTLQPLRAGELTLPVATAVVDGQLLRAKPITVSVQRGAGGGAQSAGPTPQPAPSGSGAVPFDSDQAFAIVLRVEPREAFVNQQLTAIVEYYTAYRLPHGPGQEAPHAEGFVAEALPDPDPEYVTVDGRQYVRATRRWALFPATPGSHTIKAAPEELMLPPVYQREVFESNQVRVSVKPLPTPPAGFSGAVGQFTVQISADKQRVKAGEGLTVRAIVDGTGNIQAVRAPDLKVPDWCKVYQSGEKRTSEPRTLGGRLLLGGRAEFEYLVVPRRAGQLEISGASLRYFDPAARAYKTAQSAPVSVTVTEGEVIEEATSAAGDTALMHIHTDRPRLHAHPPLPSTPVIPTVLTACALALAGSAAVRVNRQRRLSDPQGFRASAAARQARRSLASAEKLRGNAVVDAVAETVRQYLADRFALPATGIALQEIASELERRGLASPVVGRVTTLLSSCGDMRFAPGGAATLEPAALIDQAKELIDALEKAMDR